MTDLKRLKKAFKKIGIHFKESTEDGTTYISPCNKNDVHQSVNLCCDNFFEFDEDGKIASY